MVIRMPPLIYPLSLSQTRTLGMCPGYGFESQSVLQVRANALSIASRIFPLSRGALYVLAHVVGVTRIGVPLSPPRKSLL